MKPVYAHPYDRTDQEPTLLTRSKRNLHKATMPSELWCDPYSATV